MATMKDIIQSPLLLALGLFASSASGSKVVKGGIKGVLPVLIIMTPCRLRLRAGRPCGHLHHRDAAHRHPYLLCAVEEGQDPGSR